MGIWYRRRFPSERVTQFKIPNSHSGVSQSAPRVVLLPKNSHMQRCRVAQTGGGGGGMLGMIDIL